MRRRPAAALFLLLLSSLSSTSWALKSVTFVDNGRDQTLIKPIEQSRLKRVKLRIGDILGIHDVPDSKPHLDENVAREFMNRLYERENPPLDADTVVSLLPAVITTQSPNVTVLFEESELLDSSARIQSARLHVVFSNASQIQQLTLYPSLLQSRRRSSEEPNTFRLNVTRLVAAHFLQSPHPLEIMLRIDTTSDDDVQSLPRFHVFLVVALNDGKRKTFGSQDASKPQRGKRHVADESPMNTAVSEQIPFVEASGKLALLNVVATSTHCRRHGLYVNFEDLGWKQWVIRPDGFQAHYCGGACNFPLHDQTNATNHAIVQSLMHLLDGQHAVPPSCAPTQLREMKILITDNNHNVVLKRYRDMIALACGCQ